MSSASGILKRNRYILTLFCFAKHCIQRKRTQEFEELRRQHHPGVKYYLAIDSVENGVIMCGTCREAYLEGALTFGQVPLLFCLRVPLFSCNPNRVVAGRNFALCGNNECRTGGCFWQAKGVVGPQNQ